MWAQALSRRGLWTRVLSSNDMARPYMIAIIAQLTMPGLWVGSERLAEFAKSKQSEGYERPTQLRRRSNMAIYPKIETRRAKRRNGAAYQHRRRRSLTGGQAAITHGRRMEYHRSHSMFLTHSIARLTTKSWSDRASLPRKRARSAHVQKRERVLKDSEGIELTPYGPARFCQHLSVRTQLVLCLREHSLYTISFEKIEPTQHMTS